MIPLCLCSISYVKCASGINKCLFLCLIIEHYTSISDCCMMCSLLNLCKVIQYLFFFLFLFFRGICYFAVEIACVDKDLHSGLFGGTVWVSWHLHLINLKGWQYDQYLFVLFEYCYKYYIWVTIEPYFLSSYFTQKQLSCEKVGIWCDSFGCGIIYTQRVT